MSGTPSFFALSSFVTPCTGWVEERGRGCVYTDKMQYSAVLVAGLAWHYVGAPPLIMRHALFLALIDARYGP